MIILPPESMPLPRYLFFEEGQRRGYVGKRWEARDGKIYTSFIKNGRGFTMRVIPFMHTLMGKYENIGKMKKTKSDMMNRVEMPVPKQWGPYKSLESFKCDLEGIPIPMVIKPNFSTFSRGAHIGVVDKDQACSIASDLIKTFADGFVVEQQIIGDEYRIVCVEQEFVACTKRERAHVVGDGKHSIQSLIDLRNRESARGPVEDKRFTNHPIVVSEKTLQLLKDDCYTLETILPKGEKCVLTDKITAASGVDYVDYTEVIHPGYVRQCTNFMKEYNAFIIGFDLITPDITKSPAKQTVGYNEFNISPFIDLSENCNVGKKRPISATMWDHLEAHPTVFTKDAKLI